MPQSPIVKMRESPIVKWGVPVVVLAALAMLFFCCGPLRVSGPVDTAKKDSEPAVAARGSAVDEVVAGDSVADPHPLATNDPASDGLDALTGTGGVDELDELEGIAGLDAPKGAPVEFPGTGTDGVAAERGTDSEPGPPLAGVTEPAAPTAIGIDSGDAAPTAIGSDPGDGAPFEIGDDALSAPPVIVASDPAATSSAAEDDGVGASAAGEPAASGADASGADPVGATSADAGPPAVGAPGTGRGGAAGPSTTLEELFAESAAIPDLGGHPRHRFPGYDVAAAQSNLGPGLTSLAEPFDKLEPCDILGSDCVQSMGRRFVGPPWRDYVPGRLPPTP